VQVGASIADPTGRILAWGWNSVGDGYGEHAEASAIRRANKRRLEGAAIYVAAKRSKVITARPCEACRALIERWGISEVHWRDGEGLWI
jgi:deoxycytidylate deaminase